MEYFHNITILHKYNDTDFFVRCDIPHFLQLNVMNWKHNRNPDDLRIDELVKFYSKTNVIFNTVIYVHYDSTQNLFEIFDGIHRFTALSRLEPTCSILQQPLFLYVYVDKTFGELSDLFLNINKSVPVCNIYLNAETDRRDYIEQVVKEWMKRYPTHFSGSKECRVPQILRDTFVEILSDKYNEYTLRSRKALLELVDNTNDFIKQCVNTESLMDREMLRCFKKKEKAIEKCQKTGCYLFLFKPDELRTIVFRKAYDYRRKVKTI